MCDEATIRMLVQCPPVWAAVRPVCSRIASEGRMRICLFQRCQAPFGGLPDATIHLDQVGPGSKMLGADAHSLQPILHHNSGID